MRSTTARVPAVADASAKPREACGLMGVFGHPDAVALVREGLFSLQHRGEEGAGIAVVGERGIEIAKGVGLVQEVLTPEAVAGLVGDRAIGHVRYSTTGGSRPENVQPLDGECVDGPWVVAHNGNLVNTDFLRRQYQEAGALFQTGTDSEILLHLLADVHHQHRPDRLASALSQLRGAYAFLVMDTHALYAVRDPRGFKPLSLGRLGNAWVVASETCAFAPIGAVYERDVEPGEIVRIDADGLASSRLPEQPSRHAHCLFELVYFARPDSCVFRQPVHRVRLLHGIRLADESPVAADCVAPVPDSGNFAALGFSQRSGIPIDYAFIRNHYVGRTFIAPGARRRAALADRKLSVLPDAVRGRRVVVVDDSLVRGTTMRRRVAALRTAGAREVHLRIACPPIAHPCFYGIDFPTRDELAAGSRSVEEIRRMVDADTLAYLSVDGLVSPLSASDGFCLACFTGRYPLETGSADKESFETRRGYPRIL